MPTLATTIDLAARDFARTIIAAVKNASLQELLAMQTETPTQGRPTRARKAAKKINWPKCKHRGCKRNAWAQGHGLCGKHFRATKRK